jgi:DNA adenine methylase
MAKPFIKWVGGKTSQLPLLLRHAPQKFGRYYEPFVGGGALFFALKDRYPDMQAVLSDTNAELIAAYRVVRDAPQELIQELLLYPNTEDFYYKLRDAPGTMSDVQQAARFIYLNKTGYKGMYRVNKEGRFNVAFGSYLSPKICDPETIFLCSRALEGAELRCTDYTVLREAQSGDFVYCDPGDFNGEAVVSPTPLMRLMDVLRRLDARDVNIMLTCLDRPSKGVFFRDCLIEDVFETSGGRYAEFLITTRPRLSIQGEP